jgi:hypothetical protein
MRVIKKKNIYYYTGEMLPRISMLIKGEKENI